MPRRRRSRILLAALPCLVALAGGCGGSVEQSPDAAGTLALDFTPNAVHAGIFTAVARDYDGAEGVRLRVRAPGAAPDPVRLLAAGRADLAVLDITDLALARERGQDLVAVMALVQRPLAAIFAAPGVRSPRELEGGRAGLPGLPSDEAVLRSVVSGDGGDPAKVDRVRIGFNAVPALLGERVDAVTGFWNVEGVALRREEPRVNEFRLDAFGAPPYPELVVAVTRDTLREEPELVSGTTAALRRGYAEALADPESAVLALTQRARGLDRARVLAELQAVEPVFAAGAPFGELDRGRLEAWADWALRFGIVGERPDVARAFVQR